MGVCPSHIPGDLALGCPFPWIPESHCGSLNPTVSIVTPSHLTFFSHSNRIATVPAAMQWVVLGAQPRPQTPSLGPPWP